MKNAIKFNKDLHKLSMNEMKIYHELQKLLNKERYINVLIGSYLSGNNSKKLNNKISSILYNKLRNKGWRHIAPFSRLYLVKLKVVVQLKSQQ